MFGRSERLEWRADDLNGGPVLKNRTPGGYEAGIALKAGTAAALITDDERKAVACRSPYLVSSTGVMTRLNCTMRLESPPYAIKSWRELAAPNAIGSYTKDAGSNRSPRSARVSPVRSRLPAREPALSLLARINVRSSSKSDAKAGIEGGPPGAFPDSCVATLLLDHLVRAGEQRL